MMDILVTTAYGLESMRGNSVSARRIRDLLGESGYSAAVASISGGVFPEAKLLLALHARKSAPAIEKFQREYPNAKVVVLLTGSDVHTDLVENGGNSQVLANMEAADALVVAQASSMDAIPQKFHSKTHYIPKSVNLEVPEYEPPANREPFKVLMAAHVRKLKDPLLAAKAVRMLPEDSPVKITHFGEAFEDDLKGDLLKENASNPRFNWKGLVTREEVMVEMAHSHLCLNTSLMEGGANIIAEAIAIGIPVLATRIPGNTGMLGNEYPGYFEISQKESLASLLQKVQVPDFWSTLQDAVIARRKYFSKDLEKRGWEKLTGQLLG